MVLISIRHIIENHKYSEGEEIMQALFHVDNVYRDIDKIRLVLQGNIIEGTIHSNMTLLIPFNKEFEVAVHIDETELTDAKDNKLKLYSNCDDIEEVDLLIALNLINDIFIVNDDIE